MLKRPIPSDASRTLLTLQCEDKDYVATLLHRDQRERERQRQTERERETDRERENNLDKERNQRTVQNDFSFVYTG